MERDKDILKKKVLQVLTKELDATELTMVKIQVIDSAKDIEDKKLKERSYKEAYKEHLKEKKEEAAEEGRLKVKILAAYIGVDLLPNIPFVVGVADYLNLKGTITTKQTKALLSTVEKQLDE